MDVEKVLSCCRVERNLRGEKKNSESENFINFCRKNNVKIEKIQMKNRDKNGIADEQCGALRDIALVSMWAELKIAAKI